MGWSGNTFSILIITGSGSSIVFVLPGDVVHGGIVPTAPTAPNNVPGVLMVSGTDVTTGGANTQALVGLVGTNAANTFGPYIFFGSIQGGSSLVQPVNAYMVGTLLWAQGGVVGGTLVPETWHSPTLLNGWTQLAGNTAVGFRRQPDGDVMIKGALVPGTLTDATVLFTLPAGYFNAGERRSINGIGLVGSTAAVTNSPWLGISTTGDVTINGINLAGITSIRINGRFSTLT